MGALICKGEKTIENSRVQIHDEKSNKFINKPKLKNYLWLKILTTISGIILLITTLFSMTIFNESYMSKQIQDSSVASQIDQNINQQVSKLGLPSEDLVGDDLINQVLKNMVHQFYQGKAVQVDNSMVSKQVQQSLGNNNGILQQGITGVVISGVVQIINAQIDTEKISSYSKTVNEVKNINRLFEIGAIIVLVICLFSALMRKSILRIGGISAIMIGILGSAFWGLIYVSEIPSKIITNNTIAVQLGNQIIKDVMSSGFLIGIIMVVIGILLYLIGRLIRV